MAEKFTGFRNGFLFVNSAASLSRDLLGGTGADAAGRVPVAEVVRQARAQGVDDVTVENIAGTLCVGSVSIRRAIEESGGYTKRRANQIVSERRMLSRAPLFIAGLPAYTHHQIQQAVAAHDTEARRNKVRSKRPRSGDM